MPQTGLRTCRNLGTGLHDRYMASGNPADLEAMIQALQGALEATPAEAPDRPGRLSNLGIGQGERYERSHAPGDLDAAIGNFQEALDATAADAAGRPAYLKNLGRVLLARYALTGASTDRDAAIDAFRKASELGLAIAPAITLGSAQTWGAWASERGGLGRGRRGVRARARRDRPALPDPAPARRQADLARRRPGPRCRRPRTPSLGPATWPARSSPSSAAVPAC